MTIKRALAAGVLATALAVIPLAAQHRHAFAGHGAFGAHMFDRMAAALSLTEAQKTAAQQLMSDGKAQAKPIMEQMRQNRKDLAAAVESNNTGVIAQLTAQQGQLAGQLAEIRAKSMATFYAQLTPEQKAKAQQLRQQRMSRFENWKNQHSQQ